jgi:hypothetical protein
MAFCSQTSLLKSLFPITLLDGKAEKHLILLSFSNVKALIQPIELGILRASMGAMICTSRCRTGNFQRLQQEYHWKDPRQPNSKFPRISCSQAPNGRPYQSVKATCGQWFCPCCFWGAKRHDSHGQTPV